MCFNSIIYMERLKIMMTMKVKIKTFLKMEVIKVTEQMTLKMSLVITVITIMTVMMPLMSMMILRKRYHIFITEASFNNKWESETFSHPPLFHHQSYTK